MHSLGQLMYFVKGHSVAGDKQATFINTASDTNTASHTYSVEYTPEAMTWYLDNNIVRTVQASSGVKYPSQPLQLHLGVWDGTDTDGWAGTVVWGDDPTSYTAKVSHVTVTSYTC